MPALLEYKCPCCGGKIEFNSGSQKMKCPYCDTEFDVEALKAYDEDSANHDEDNISWQTEAGAQWTEDEAGSMTVYVCNSCGGEIIADKNTGATTCPYCGNPVIIKGSFSGGLKPDFLIPFKLDKNAAKQGYYNHLKGKRLLPKIFKDENHIDEIKGIYVPFWLFEAYANAYLRYKATRVNCWSDSRYDYTRTTFFSVVRGGSVSFDGVPVDGSSRMPDDLMESIEPFDFSGAVDFQTAYLSGYLADKYDVTAENSISRANERIKRSTEQVFSATIDPTYTTLVNDINKIDINNGKASYALYPVWLLNTTYKGKSYIFAMNGQTGKMVGDLPTDWGAYWRWYAIFAAIFVVIAVLGTLGFMLLL